MRFGPRNTTIYLVRGPTLGGHVVGSGVVAVAATASSRRVLCNTQLLTFSIAIDTLEHHIMSSVNYNQDLNHLIAYYLAIFIF